MNPRTSHGGRGLESPLPPGRGAVKILVSHFSTVRMADLIVVMDGGRVVQAGEHAALLAEGGLCAELFELQARAYL